MSEIREYIGARYVPIFGRKGEDSAEWDNSAPYEPLTIVLYQGNSYTSRQYVPAGVDISNEQYWALTGNYNAQVEAYRAEVGQFADRITDAENGVLENSGAIAAEVADRISADDELRESITALENSTTELFTKSKYEPASINRANIFARVEFDYGVAGIQSLCAFSQDGIQYLAAGFSNATINIYNVGTGALVNTFSNSNLGHVNQMCYRNRTIYVTPLTDAIIISININNINSPAYTIHNLNSAGFTSVSAFDNYNDSFIALESNHLYKFDFTSNTRELIVNLPVINYYPGIPQTVRYSSRLDKFYLVRGGTNKVIYFDRSAVISTITNFSPSYKLASVTELEDFIYFNEQIFFASQAQTGYVDSVSLSNIFVTNFIDVKDNPDELYIPNAGILNISIDNTASGLNDNRSNIPGYGASGIFTLKYPCDILNLKQINDINSGHVAVNFANNCKYVLPVTCNMTIDCNAHSIGGIWVSDGSAFIYDIFSAQDPSTFVQRYNNQPVLIYCSGGKVVVTSGPSTPLTNAKFLVATRTEVWCVQNVTNSATLASCYGNSQLSFL